MSRLQRSLGLVAALALAGYFGLLVDRTHWFRYSASVGGDAFGALVIVALAGLLSSALPIRKRSMPTAVDMSLLVANIVVTLLFAILLIMRKLSPIW